MPTRTGPRCSRTCSAPAAGYLAPGSAVGEEFDDGGVLQIWEVAALVEAHERFLRTPRGQRSGANAELVRQAAHARHISAVFYRLRQAPQETYLGLGSYDRYYLTLCALRIVATGSDREIQR